MSKPKVIGIIPSRLKSSRVPEKPLADIDGMPMIVHVYRRAEMSPILDDLYVATDSEQIKDVVEHYGGKAVITSTQHLNGTERAAEAVKELDCDYVVLINGDEALLNPEHIEVSVRALSSSNADASILVNEFDRTNSSSDFKVVLNLDNEVMYISRGDIPSDARHRVPSRLKAYHILTFHKKFLRIYSGLERSPLECVEDHEHLRILENGYKIVAAKVASTAISVDTLDDLEYVRGAMPTDLVYQRYTKVR